MKQKIEIEPFGFTLWLVVEESRQKLLKWVKSKFDCSISHLDLTFAAITASLDDSTYLVYMPLLSKDAYTDISTSIHEAVHVASSILRACSIKNEECLAYLTESISSKMIAALAKKHMLYK